MTAWADMKHDLVEGLGEPMTRREKVTAWIDWYWWPTCRWVPKIKMWWHHNVQGYPRRPPLELDPVAQHLGFVEGVPPCTDGPRCAAHGLTYEGPDV